MNGIRTGNKVSKYSIIQGRVPLHKLARHVSKVKKVMSVHDFMEELIGE